MKVLQSPKLVWTLLDTSTNLPAYRNNKWHVQACNAISGDGLYEGFERMSDMLKEYKRDHYDARM